MRSTLKFVLLFLSLLTVFAGPEANAATDDEFGDRVLMSPEQGQALAEFALQSERRIHPRPDCSHLVHLLYARAGLIYSYQDSRVLYRGISDFERVKTPQAGDLAVWLGHVGIVLSPEEKTFISSVRSGILVESWTAAHWVHRGRPRFYRYRIGPAANMNLLAAIMVNDTHAGDELRNARGNTSGQLPFSAAESTAGTEEDGSPAVRNESLPHDLITGSTMHEADVGSSSIIVLLAQRQTPTKRQIAAAIIESSNTHARQLMDGETLDLERPFSVFDRLEVEKVKIKHESGWVTLRVSEIMCQDAGKVLAGRNMERELSIVRRNDGVWVISDPQHRIYVAQELAVEIFERQTEVFLRRAPNSSNTRTVVKTLDRLYDQQSGRPQRAAIR